MKIESTVSTAVMKFQDIVNKEIKRQKILEEQEKQKKIPLE